MQEGELRGRRGDRRTEYSNIAVARRSALQQCHWRPD